jgi:hypothetical protein
MEIFVRRFIRASLLWLGVGVLIGLAMALSPRALVYRPAHMHANLLGFVSMMIFGVAYHVLPRFTGNPLHSRALAMVHWWVANGGLALMVAGWVARAHWYALGTLLLGAGALLGAAGAFLFIHNIWRTLGPARAGPGPRPPTPPGPRHG